MKKTYITALAAISCLSMIAQCAHAELSSDNAIDTLPVGYELQPATYPPVSAQLDSGADILPPVSMPEVTVDQALMDKPLFEWQLNLTTIVLVTMILGRVLGGIRRGGGIKSISTGLWFGDNTPPK